MIRDSTKSRVLQSLSSFIPRSQYVVSGMSGCTNDTAKRVLLELERDGLVVREKIENKKNRTIVEGWRKVARNGNGAKQEKKTDEKGVE
jgi:predicted transcriptional regulator